MNALVVEAAFGLMLLVLFISAWFTGKALGQRLHTKLAAHPQLGVVQGAILALLGLQLAFCFAGAMSRYVDRQDGLVEEANALSTFYLRADLLPEPQRDAVRSTRASTARTASCSFNGARRTMSRRSSSGWSRCRDECGRQSARGSKLAPRLRTSSCPHAPT